jgi:hypothetical protein
MTSRLAVARRVKVTGEVQKPKGFTAPSAMNILQKKA